MAEMPDGCIDALFSIPRSLSRRPSAADGLARRTLNSFHTGGPMCVFNTSPFETELIHALQVADVYSAEKRLHSKFADKRVNGEWFELDETDIEYIKGLGAQDG
jgi:hypothetical protein